MANIDIVEIDNRFELDFSGKEEVLNRRTRNRLKRLSGEHEGHKFHFSFTEETKEKVYEEILYIIEEAGVELSASGDAADFISRKLAEEERFSIFSQQAYDIRNNIEVSENLEKFSNIIRQTMVREPYALQLLSAYHLAFAQNACNFSVPGTGKTTVVYAAYSFLKSLPADDAGHVNRILVICPLSAFGPWETEYEDCFGVPPRVKKLVGLNRSERHIYLSGLDAAEELTLVSYQTAANDIEEIKRFLSANPNTMVVLDEAHRIKNTDSEAVWAQAILSIGEFAKSRVVLTGTPAPNKPSDIWNYYKFIWPTKKVITLPIGYLDDIQSEEDKKKFINQISPFFVRVKKSDLALPNPIIHPPIEVAMDENQQKIYDYLESSAVAEFKDYLIGEDTQDVLRAAKMIRMRQCASNPALLKLPLEQHYYETGEVGVLSPEVQELIQGYDATPPKFEALLDLLDTILSKDGPDGKVIVWSNFVSNLKALSRFLDENGIKNRILTGEVPTQNERTPVDVETRQKIVSSFHKKDCDFRVILANPAAVGESISLHKACRNSVYFEKDYNAATFMQSKDRIHRYGLPMDASVNYYFLISSNSIDLEIHNRVSEKERIMLEIIENEEIPLFQAYLNEDLSQEDIASFLRGYYARADKS